MSWRDLILADHTTLGFERLPREKVGGPPIAGMTPDEKYLVLRFASGSGRIVGFREGRIYHLVWVDTKLDLYAH